MKKQIKTIFICIVVVTQFSCAQLINSIPNLNSSGLSLTNEDAVAALKEALKVGTDTAVSVLSKADGFYKNEMIKVLLPPEAQNMYKNLSKVPGGKDMMEKTILAMNRAAEDASKDAAPIFKNAVTSMTITDGINIVKGNDNAATMYLKDKTFNQLKDAFTPKIRASLSKPLVFSFSAETSYKELINAYNKASINGVLYDRITTNSLSEYVTQKGLEGLFLKVADQEKKIRNNPVAQVTEILRKVFGKK